MINCETVMASRMMPCGELVQGAIHQSSHGMDGLVPPKLLIAHTNPSKVVVHKAAASAPAAMLL
ncbi:hypothetical protein VV02_00855 [Luteipulveratus mongoliensis]|uniref:Uncharacterized protein n=1 Tax=Luteipulveratus mongoliensis TaxID=571913 RepID=A0A0K1JDV4_9MICO|nr:hypothetical protein VV02_00855 [Luteipulveratus mongoliensis]